MKQKHNHQALERFFKTVAHLTKNHRGFTLKIDPSFFNNQEHEVAHISWVSPHDLGQALDDVDPNWAD